MTQDKRITLQKSIGVDGSKTQLLKPGEHLEVGLVPPMAAQTLLEKMPEVASKQYDPSQFTEARVASEVLEGRECGAEKESTLAADLHVLIIHIADQ